MTNMRGMAVVLALAVACKATPDFSQTAINRWPLGSGLPSGFYFGAGTSAHQVEGSNDNDWTVWEQGKFSDNTPHIKDGQQSGLASNSWNRWPDDIVALRSLGANAYRLSIEWSRIVPEQGAWDQSVVDRYRAQLIALRAAGVEPFVTVHHFTFPKWIAALGGWLWPGVTDEVGNHCQRIGAAFGDLVDEWLTVNEANAIVLLAFATGDWPPGLTNNKDALNVYATLIESHAACARGLRQGDVVDANGDGRATWIGIRTTWKCTSPARPARSIRSLRVSPISWSMTSYRARCVTASSTSVSPTSSRCIGRRRIWSARSTTWA